METVHSRETESFKSKIKNNPGSYAILLFPNWVNFFTNQPRKTLPTHGNVFHNGSNNIFRKKLPGKTVHPLDGKKRTPRKKEDFNKSWPWTICNFTVSKLGQMQIHYKSHFGSLTHQQGESTWVIPEIQNSERPKIKKPIKIPIPEINPGKQCTHSEGKLCTPGNTLDFI